MRHFLGKVMNKTIKTSLITLALLIIWMFTGIFSSDNSNEFPIESENLNQEKALVLAKVFNAKP